MRNASNGAPFLKELGRRVRERRLEKGLSQEELAGRARLSPRFVSQVESGAGNISILRLFDLARALDARLDELVRWREPAARRVIALIGLRGAGKSTLGRRAARSLKLPFFELDRLIEQEAGLGLGEIFALHGEAYYRRLERQVLRRFLSSGQPGVLATGGGVVTDRASFDLLKRGALTFWLKARPEEHLERVAAQGDRRPMAERSDPLTELRALLREREPLYRQAAHTIDTSRLSAAKATQAIVRLTHL